jgi:hypothetical protein
MDEAVHSLRQQEHPCHNYIQANVASFTAATAAADVACRFGKKNDE